MQINIPVDHKLEALLLGACLRSFQGKELVLEKCTIDDFDNAQNRLIFQEIQKLDELQNSIDLMSFFNFISSNGTVDKIGGETYLDAIVNSVHSGMNYLHYIDKLKNITMKRNIIKLGISICEKAGEKEVQGEDILEELNQEVFKLQTLKSEETHTATSISKKFSEHGSMMNHVQWAMDRQKKKLPPYIGKQSFYKELDQIFGFFQNKAIYYIGARTSMGKTTFLINLMTNMFANRPDEAIGLFTLEQPGDIFYKKIVSFLAGVEFTRVQDGLLTEKEFERILECDKTANKFPLHLVDEPNLKISKLRMRARKLKKEHDIKILFIDYLTMIRADGHFNSKHLEVNEISKNLQHLARELDIPIICLAQLNREAAKLNNGTPVRPTLTSFRESGSIEEDADGCILLHRPDYFNPSLKRGIIEVIIAKNRRRGKLKVLEFERDPNSERWDEKGPLGDEVKMINIESQYKDSSYEM